MRGQANVEGARGTEQELLEQLYERMYLIRSFETMLLDLFSVGKIAGTTHTCIGQEANAVGLIAHLRPERDIVVSNHRCHGHYLAFTDDVDGLLREVMGKRGGVCGGKGGSQHLCNGNFFSNGVLGSTVPVATGMSFAERERGPGSVTTVFIGDGTLGQGVLYESLNVVALWRLPILVVCENNHYAQSTPSSLTVAGRIADRARAFGIEATEVDTTDVLEVHTRTGPLVEQVRATGEPHFLVLDTYRLSPHSKGDDFRDPDEIEQRRLVEPIRIGASQLGADRRATIEEACARRLAEALAAADEAPPASPDE